MVKSAIGLFRRSRRRTMLCLMPVLIVGLSSWGFAQRTDFHIRVRQTATMSLTLIKPTDAEFDGTLESYFPGLAEEDGYQQAIRPYLAIVRNDSGLPAVAYAITWTAHYTPGWVRPLRAIFVNRRLMYHPAMTYIPPQSIRLISPLFNVTPKQYQANSYFTQMYPASHFPPSGQLTSVDVSVDGVVYRDGSFIGPDTTHILERHVAARFAERDEALAALIMIKASTAPPSVIAGQLEKMFDNEDQRDEQAYQHTLLALYVRSRDGTAMDLRRILRGRGLAGLEKLLQSLVNPSEGNTKPSAFGRMYQKLSDSDPRVFGTIPWNPKGP